MGLTDDMQCSLTVMWMSTFAMIICGLLNSLWGVVFLAAFIFGGMCFAKQLFDRHDKAKQGYVQGNVNDDDEAIELQPLESSNSKGDPLSQPPPKSKPPPTKERRNMKDMTIGELMATY